MTSEKAGTDPEADWDDSPSETDEPEDTTSDDPSLPACADGSRLASPITVLAAAPLGLVDEDMGRPVDARFNTLSGSAGRSVFQGDPPLQTSRVDTIDHRHVTISNTRQMDAEARFWVFSGGINLSNTQNYVSYHATQMEEIRKIDETYDFREDLPEAAKYYIHALHYGHSFDVLLHGNDSVFDAGARLDFSEFGASISLFAESHGLSMTAKGRGMEPRSGDAIFARTAEEITGAYSSAGPAVPVYVEYRSIPHACLPEAERAGWEPPTRAIITFEKMVINNAASNDNWNVSARCRLDGSDALLSDPIVLENEMDVTPGSEYTLGWSTTVDVLAGQNLRCGVFGEAFEAGSGLGGGDTDSIPYGEFNYDVRDVNLDTNPDDLPYFEASNSGIGYRVYYSMTFMER